MKELALHILDIVQNSIKAEATKIEIEIIEDLKMDMLTINIIDNGKGMDKQMLDKVLDPFVTTRTTRKVGLGLSLFKAAANQCEGDLIIASRVNEGTNVSATFKHSHIDRAPIGNMADTMVTFLMSEGNIDYIYKHIYNEQEFNFDTIEIKKVLQEVPITDYSVIQWLREYIKEGTYHIGRNVK